MAKATSLSSIVLTLSVDEVRYLQAVLARVAGTGKWREINDDIAGELAKARGYSYDEYNDANDALCKCIEIQQRGLRCDIEGFDLQ